MEFGFLLRGARKSNKMPTKKKKPKFIRTDSNKKKFNKKWRKPRGLHNKIRLAKKGHQSRPAIGYRSPKKIRNLHKSGLKPVIITNLNKLTNLDTKTQGIILSSSLGQRKKIQILEKCLELKLIVLNVKDIQEYITKVKENLKKKKLTAAQREEEKKKKEVELKEKEKKEEVEKTEEEQKKEEEKEKKEVLKKESPKQKQPEETMKKAMKQPMMRTKIPAGDKR